jgi:hypothetical protein
MKKSVRFLMCLLLAVSVISCQKEISEENGGNGPVTGVLKMKIDGQQWVADKSASATILAGFIAINGVSNDNKNLLIQLQDQGEAAYQLDQQSLGVAVYADGNDAATDAFATDAGNSTADAGGIITITKIDKTNKTITGTFVFKAYRDSDSKQVVITEGSFENLKYTDQLQPTTGSDFKVKIDGTLWTAKSVQGIVQSGELNLIATELDFSKTVSLTMPANITAGTYDLADATKFISFYMKGTTDIFAAISGSMTITENNAGTKTIKGTFNFDGLNIIGNGTTAKLTEGTFSIKYQ